MAKLCKQYYYTNGEKKVNCYKATISKLLVEKLALQDKQIKIYEKDGEIRIKELKDGRNNK